MSEISNRPNPFNQYAIGTFKTSVSGSTVYASQLSSTGTLSGSALSTTATGTISGSTASLKDLTASGTLSGSTISGTSTITGSAVNAATVTTSGTVSCANVIGIGTVTGSTCKIMGPSGSIDFANLYGTASGSLVASLTLKVNVTGSTYYVQLWA